LRLGYWLAHRFVYYTVKLLWGLKITRYGCLPKAGPVVIASNHISFIDPPVVAVSIKREAHFAAKEPLFRNKILGPIITYLNAFPVKRGGFDNAALKNSLQALYQGGVLIMFPEGTRSRIGDLLPFKRGIGYVVSKTQAVVLPVYIEGSNQLKRRFFQPGGITIRIGEPIYNLADKFPGKEGFDLIASAVKEEIIKLKVKSSS